MDWRTGKLLRITFESLSHLSFSIHQVLWLAIAYRLEFLGQDVFFPLWVSSVIFLCANSFVLIELVKAYR